MLKRLMKGSQDFECCFIRQWNDIILWQTLVDMVAATCSSHIKFCSYIPPFICLCIVTAAASFSDLDWPLRSGKLVSPIMDQKQGQDGGYAEELLATVLRFRQMELAAVLCSVSNV